MSEIHVNIFNSFWRREIKVEYFGFFMSLPFPIKDFILFFILSMITYFNPLWVIFDIGP